MPASGFKSRGGGSILLVLLVLLGVAGASAFFIHKILTAEDAPVAVTQQPESSRTGEDLGPPVVLRPGASPPSSGAVPQGQFVVPPSRTPLQPPEETEGVPGQAADPGVRPPETLQGDAAAGEPGASQGGPFAGTTPGAPQGVPVTGTPGAPQGGPFASMPGASQSDASAAGSPAADGQLPADPAPNLLLVPGAIEPPPPAAREDAVVRPAFVDDIAAFLAQNYWPQNTHPLARRGGITTASLQWANLRYGAELRSLDGRGGDPGGARRAILGYILNPAVVGRIYGVYSDGFVAALRQEADKRVVGEGSGKRSLSPAEKREMFTIYSGFAARIAGALESYAADPSMPGKVQSYAQAEQAVQDANKGYLESMLAHEEAVGSDDRARITAARLHMDKEAATYQKRIRERETAKNVLVNGMRKGRSGQNGADTLVYAAFWAYRRGPDNAQALRACAKALTDMSAKLTASSRRIQ